MRGDDVQQQAMFSYLSPEARVPQDHPLRPIRDMVNQALAELSGEFQAMYSREGRPSIPPEKLLRALLLQVLYTPQRPTADGTVRITISCFAGLSGSPWTTRSGTIPSFPRIRSAFSTRTWPRPFSGASWRRRGSERSSNGRWRQWAQPRGTGGR